MNNLTDSHSVANLLNSRFNSIIVTDIVRNDGETAQMLTLLPFPGMFDEIVMGINKGLKGGGKATKWQSRVYSFRGGHLTRPITYRPIIISDNTV